MSAQTDSIYASPRDTVEPFQFDEAVTEVFQDMIERSVPGYQTTLEMISLVARKFAQPHTKGYDLGSSLGASTLAMRHGMQLDGCQIIAVDNSEPMMSKFTELLEESCEGIPIKTLVDDIQNVEIKNASMVTLNFTLQFIAPQERLPLLTKIYDGMVPGGALVISEKITFPDAHEQELQTNLHHSFKRTKGYSELEVSQKRTSLENVLVPDTLEQHRQRLREAGFTQVYIWFQCFSFVSILAHK